MPFKKGDPKINRDGRPKGAGISITTAIKKELERVPEGKKASYLELLVKQILRKGIVEGDSQTIKQIWNYIDGMPTQKVENINDSELEQTLEILKDAIKKTK